MVELQTTLVLEPMKVIMKVITAELYFILGLEHILALTWGMSVTLEIMMVLETMMVTMWVITVDLFSILDLEHIQVTTTEL